jgi:hypothetical protein
MPLFALTLLFMQKKLLLLAALGLIALIHPTLNAQNLTSVVRGTVVDAETKFPLPGAFVQVGNQKVVTDGQGLFRLSGVPIGRQTVLVSLIGYEKTSRAIELTSAKEAVLTLPMVEASTQLEEVAVKATQSGQAKNEMAVVSARQFSVEETNLYAGSRGEPARMATNFAGVQGSDDQRNDLVVRGNTPSGVLYRMEGINIPNPNHFSIPGTGGGPVTILNNKFLDNSDFFTGAWPAEYGNAIAGVFDLKMRDGNNEKFEVSGQLGFLGTELMVEGPLGKGRAGRPAPSFLGVYRYSTLIMFQKLGIPLGTSAVPGYMDGAFRLTFPQKNGGKLAAWGMFGRSNIDIMISDTDGDKVSSDFESYGTTDRDQYFKTDMYVTGLNYTKPISRTSYLNAGVAVSQSYIDTRNDKVFRSITPDSTWKVDDIVNILGYKFTENKLHGFAHYIQKLNNRTTFKMGLNADFYDLHYNDSVRKVDGRDGSVAPWRVQWDTHAQWGVLQPYASLRSNLTEKLSATAGWTMTYSNVNAQSYNLVEPRVGLNYKYSKRTNFFAGSGIHSQMQSAYLYYYAIGNNGRDPGEHNTQMGLTKSYHSVAGVEHRSASAPIRLKAEVYYQYLWNVPVEQFKMDNNPLSATFGQRVVGSSFSMVNAGSGFGRLWPDTLENSGTGQNFGLELTAEHFFSKGFYGLMTASLFDAKYRGSDNVLRNTTFNGQYAFNFIVAKEWRLAGKRALQLSGKFTTVGGRWFGPVDEEKSLENLEINFISSTFNTEKYRAYYRTDVKFLYKWNFAKTSHELGIDMANVLNNRNILTLTFVPDHPSGNPVQEEYQLGRLPIFYYRIDF